MTDYPLSHPATSARATAASRHVAILAGDPAVACGVGDFTNGLQATLARRGAYSTEAINLNDRSLTPLRLWRRIARAGTVIANVPLVAWKRLPVKPLAAIALARLTGRHAVVMLHEWQALHPLRRLALRPLVVMASHVVMFSPTIRAELSADPLAGWAVGKASLAPLPPNIRRPDEWTESEFSRRLESAKREGRLIVGVFGSIYPGKLPLAALAIAQELKARGENPLIAFIGNFVRASDNIEDIFWSEVRARGLHDNVAVSGFVTGDAELFAIFAKIDAFAYRFAEGMTARRSSVLAAVQSGRPVVVTAPANADEFAHHAKFAELVERGTLVLVPAGANDAAYADSILAAAHRKTADNPIVTSDWWNDAAAAIEPLLRSRI